MNKLIYGKNPYEKVSLMVSDGTTRIPEMLGSFFKFE